MEEGGREEPNPLPVQIYKGQCNLPATDQQTARTPPSNARVGLSAGTGFQLSTTLRSTAQLSMPRGHSKKGVSGSAPSKCPRPNYSIPQTRRLKTMTKTDRRILRKDKKCLRCEA